jgi:pimeloyl-ACP methyl ester carboxylesterase
MERRTALKSMLLALAGGDAASAARKPSGVAPRATIAEAADKTRLHFRDWGAGRPIVFVAPWALSSDWWDMPMSVFAERGWRCVAFDRRGHGRSEEPGRGYDFDTLADDIAAVMNALDLQNVVLVGHSLGGAEVVRYLTRHRSRRVAHAVLIAPTTPFGMKTEDHPDGMSKENLEKTLESIRRDFPRQVAKAAPDFFGVPKNPVPGETMDWWCRQIVDRSSVKVLSDLFKTMKETDFRPELRTIQTPTLILQGDIDKSALPELTGRPTHELIAGSRLLVYENAAHALPYTHTDRMLTDIVAFART